MVWECGCGAKNLLAAIECSVCHRKRPPLGSMEIPQGDVFELLGRAIQSLRECRDYYETEVSGVWDYSAADQVEKDFALMTDYTITSRLIRLSLAQAKLITWLAQEYVMPLDHRLRLKVILQLAYINGLMRARLRFPEVYDTETVATMF